jgi:Fur family ferric uptake transcriptional regulator
MHGLKKTGYRLSILQVFFFSQNAITNAEIEQLLQLPVDRVTLYRILKVFEETGIIHRVIDINGVPKFALSIHKKLTDKGKTQPQHLHFSCIKCKNIFCLDGPAIPKVTIPDTYEVHSLNMTIVGVCQNCNKL